MEQRSMFDKRADSDNDSDRPTKRPCTAVAALPNQLGSATSPAVPLFGTTSFGEKPSRSEFSSTPTSRLFGTGSIDKKPAVLESSSTPAGHPLFGTISSEEKPVGLGFSSNPTTLFGAPGLSNPTTFTPSIFGAAKLSTPPLLEQQPNLFGAKSITEIPISGTSASHSLPETPAVSNSIFTNHAPALGLLPSAKTNIFGSPPTGLRIEDPSLKRDEPTTTQETGDIVKQEPQQEVGLENNTETVSLKTEEVAAIAPTKSFDDHGDLTLVVGEAQSRFLVCSHSLRRVSPTWHDRLYGQSSDPKDREGAHGWVLCLPEDNPDAMRIILRVAHGNLSEIPAVLSRDMLFHLTALCDRHDMMELLKSCWSGWVQKLPKPLFHPTTFVQQVWIAHKLGHLEWYKEALSGFLCSTLKGDTGRLISETHPNIDYYSDPYLQELGLLKDWEAGRLKIIEAAGDILRDALDRLSNPQITTCCSGNPVDTCDCAMLGGVHRALYGKLWYSGGASHWEQDVAISVRRLLAKMEGIRTAAIGESRMRKKEIAHRACTPWTHFGLEDILQVCPVGCAVPIDTAAFQKQAEKCGLHILAAASNRPVVSTDSVPRANQPETGWSMFGNPTISSPTFWELQRAKKRSG